VNVVPVVVTLVDAGAAVVVVADVGVVIAVVNVV
jgi:hypothetical protein